MRNGVLRDFIDVTRLEKDRDLGSDIFLGVHYI